MPVLFASTLKPYDLGIGEHAFKIQLDKAKIISRVVCSLCESSHTSKVVSSTEALQIGELGG